MTDATAGGPNWDGAPAYMDIERPPEPKAKAKKKRKKKSAKKDDLGIPMLPNRGPILPSGTVGGVTARGRAAVALKLEGASYVEIAEVLEFDNPEEAAREVEATIAKTHTAPDYETLRTIGAARAEMQLRRSTMMANADYLVTTDKDGEEVQVPNAEKLRWHQQAGVDLMNWAALSGAKAPTKVEITPDEAKMDDIVARITRSLGVEPVLDAEVLELTALPADASDDE